MADLPIAEEPVPAEPEGPKARRRPRARKPVASAVEVKLDAVEAEVSPEAPAPEPVAEDKPKRSTRAKKKADDAPVEPKPAGKKKAAEPATPTPEPSNEDQPGEPRRGWWQRTFG